MNPWLRRFLIGIATLAHQVRNVLFPRSLDNLCSGTAWLQGSKPSSHSHIPRSSAAEETCNPGPGIFKLQRAWRGLGRCRTPCRCPCRILDVRKEATLAPARYHVSPVQACQRMLRKTVQRPHCHVLSVVAFRGYM